MRFSVVCEFTLTAATTASRMVGLMWLEGEASMSSGSDFAGQNGCKWGSRRL